MVVNKILIRLNGVSPQMEPVVNILRCSTLGMTFVPKKS